MFRAREVRTLKKQAELKYPNSANLFKFCRRVLDHKYGGIRVIDQDVGQILGFDPADCSHWKKGKKNIRSIQAMKSIADHLGIDEHLVVDVASGEMTDMEAYWEYTGYGTSKLDPKILEAAKKDFFRKNTGSWSRSKDKEFREFFRIDQEYIRKKVDEIHKKIGFREAPLYFPEISSNYSDLQLRPEVGWSGPEEAAPLKYFHEGTRFVIIFRSGSELKPFMRYRVARALAAFFLPTRQIDSENMKVFGKHIQEIESNIFAAHMLAPEDLIRKECKGLPPSADMIAQLSEIFWVSRSFMSQRILDLLLAKGA